MLLHLTFCNRRILESYNHAAKVIHSGVKSEIKYESQQNATQLLETVRDGLEWTFINLRDAKFAQFLVPEFAGPVNRA